MRLLRTTASMLLIALACTTVTACSGPSVAFVDENASYTLEEASLLPDMLARPEYEGRPTDDAAQLRREALVELRGDGSVAAELAEFITRSLPTQTRAVPYYGEAAYVDGEPVWIVAELWGSEGGTLDKTRTWVFDRTTGEVIHSSFGP